MVSALLVVALVVFIVGFILLGIGIYKVYNDQKTNTGTTPNDLTGWFLVVAGVIAIFTGIILLVANAYQSKLKKANAKITFLTSDQSVAVKEE